MNSNDDKTRETPAALGYRWPAEWEPHASTWLSWPHNINSWPEKFEPVPKEFAQFVRTLARYEPVNINAGGAAVMEQARALVGDCPNVTLHDIPTNDAWCRDHGPTFLVGPKNQPAALIDWQYNAWGGKYPPFDQDNLVPQRIAAIQQRWRFEPGIILEGGAIDGNGRGTLLTTESCLLNPNRNAGLGREATEQYLRDYLGAANILWLTGGEVAGDDTDGHIDQLARFVSPTTVVVATCEDQDDENYEPTLQNLRELSELRDEQGRQLTVVPLPLPKPMFVDDQRLPTSYCNFVFANGAIIVPQFGDRAADERAIVTLAELCPDREVVGSPSLNLIWGLGSFHCLSQQEPVAR